VRLVWGSVSAVEAVEAATQMLLVELDDDSRGKAINYVGLVGACVCGDRVLVNTTAVDLSLGTGGVHFVISRIGEGTGVGVDDPSGGHIMKLRYTPMQRDVLAVESPESPHHSTMAACEGIDGVPVVCCGLHSQVPLVAAAAKAVDPSLRVVYCMTDQAALLSALSDVMRQSRAAGLLDATVTCGQALGGEFEAVNLHSGLVAARHVARADIVIVGVGPGIVGTATPLGHSGIAQGEALNAVTALGGAPIACIRVSFADERARHRVVSHHTLAALTRIALAPVTVAVPHLASDQQHELDEVLERAGVWTRHIRADGPPNPAPPDLRGVDVTTMGRGFEQDSAFFFSAYAAGEVAARSVSPEIADRF
jgi:hypothetical protein